MINISTVIKEIVEEDEIILEMLRADMLNLSSYARSIHKEVEKRSFKEVKLKSLIVSLSRFAKQYPQEENNLPLKLDTLSVHVNLVDLSYEKTKGNLIRTEKLMKLFTQKETFFTLVQGITEITIIADTSLIAETKHLFEGENPLSEMADLVGITVKSDVIYTQIPGQFYSLLHCFKVKKINIIEIVSTSTEITFVIDKKDIQLAISQLSKFLV